ncbi:MAG: 5-bromo-4-chloroindolyl phosphate hydrolysis family protein [Rubricella sp.]
MVAKRFGGKHSPGGSRPEAAPVRTSRWDDRPVARGSKGSLILFAAPTPLLFSGIGEVMQGDPVGIVVELGAYAILMGSAWVIRDGVRAEQEFDARRVARPPKVPRKILGSIGTGAGVALAAAFAWPLGIVAGVAMGGLAAGAAILAFGLDPMKAKGLDGQSDFERDRVANAVDRAEALLAELVAEADRSGDRAVRARIDGLVSAARGVIRAVEEDPRDLPRARKFLGLYITGARDATAKFADIWTRSRDPQARESFESVIDDLETTFLAHRERLLIEDRTDLDIEIDVIRHRLQQEGLQPRNEE